MSTASLLGVVNTQQKLGVAIAVVLTVGWAGYLLIHVKKSGPVPGSEIELAPNRKPYYEDDVLETKKLDRSLSMALVLLAIIAVGLPTYWVRESTRQKDSAVGFDRRAVHRGHSLFQPTDSTEKGAHFGCGTCHGVDGAGGVVKYTITDGLGRSRSVDWKAPSLNDVAYRYTADPAKTNQQLREVLVYGRANSPMPAWGTKGGGPMNDQQIDDLVAYLTTARGTGKEPLREGLKIPLAEAKQQADDKALASAKSLGITNTFGQPEVTGEALFDANCARCHTKGWSYGELEVTGGGAYGFNLRGGSTIRQFPNEDDMIKFITEGAPYGAPYGVRGIGQTAGGGMPHFGEILDPDEIAAIVAYERTL